MSHPAAPPLLDKPTLLVVDDERGVLTSDPNLTFKHEYPPTKLMFIPDKEGTRPDLLATTGEFLHIWRVNDDNVRLELLLNNVSQAEQAGFKARG